MAFYEMVSDTVDCIIADNRRSINRNLFT